MKYNNKLLVKTLLLAVLFFVIVNQSRKEQAETYYQTDNEEKPLEIIAMSTDNVGSVVSIDSQINSLQHFLTKTSKNGTQIVRPAAVKIEFQITNIDDVSEGSLNISASNDMESSYKEDPLSDGYSEFYLCQKIGKVTAIKTSDFDGRPAKADTSNIFQEGHYVILQSPDKLWRKLALVSETDFKKSDIESTFTLDQISPKKYKLEE